MAIKKSMEAVVAFLTACNDEVTAVSLTTNPAFLKLVEAGKGGFTGVSSFIEVDGNKVGRVCAMTGAVYPFNNDDREESFYYKNGSYVIGGEILKANQMKEFDDAKEAKLADLEDQMLEGIMNSKEWKEQVTAIKATSFEFHLSDDRKQELITAYDGYADRESFLTAYNAGSLPRFVDYTEVTDALRAEYVKPE